MKDDELLALYKKERHSEYFAELFRRYIPLVYGLCYKYLENNEDSKDAVMDIYEKVSKSVLEHEVSNFYSWLFSIVKNHCLAILRKEKKTFFVEIDQDVMENEEDFHQLDRQQTIEEDKALEFCLNELKTEQQVSVKLFYYENKSYSDIVDITGYTLEKVKSYIQNGKRNLKNCMIRILNT